MKVLLNSSTTLLRRPHKGRDTQPRIHSSAISEYNLQGTNSLEGTGQHAAIPERECLGTQGWKPAVGSYDTLEGGTVSLAHKESSA